MPRPKSKSELLTASQANFEKLNSLIDSFSEKEKKEEFSPGTLNRNIRDVLAHLHHWHLMMAEWHTVGMKGEKPAMPAEGYTWRTVPDLNQKIWEEYKNTDLEKVRKLLKSSFEKIQKIIHGHSDEELFEKKKYKWTGSTSLGAYLISATTSHYAWAYKLIRKAKK